MFKEFVQFTWPQRGDEWNANKDIQSEALKSHKTQLNLEAMAFILEIGRPSLS